MIQKSGEGSKVILTLREHSQKYGWNNFTNVKFL